MSPSSQPSENDHHPEDGPWTLTTLHGDAQKCILEQFMPNLRALHAYISVVPAAFRAYLVHKKSLLVNAISSEDGYTIRATRTALKIDHLRRNPGASCADLQSVGAQFTGCLGELDEKQLYTILKLYRVHRPLVNSALRQAWHADNTETPEPWAVSAWWRASRSATGSTGWQAVSSSLRERLFNGYFNLELYLRLRIPFCNPILSHQCRPWACLVGLPTGEPRHPGQWEASDNAIDTLLIATVMDSQRIQAIGYLQQMFRGARQSEDPVGRRLLPKQTPFFMAFAKVFVPVAMGRRVGGNDDELSYLDGFEIIHAKWVGVLHCQFSGRMVREPGFSSPGSQLATAYADAERRALDFNKPDQWVQRGLRQARKNTARAARENSMILGSSRRFRMSWLDGTEEEQQADASELACLEDFWAGVTNAAT